jgi:hypothetical protein
VLHRAYRASLDLEAPQPVDVVAGLDQHLDRHRAPKSSVDGAIDLSHSARAERREDLERPESGAGGECHSVSRGF